MPVSYDYDTNYEPLAPTMPVGLSSSGETSASQEIVTLVDTRADAKMIPWAKLVSRDLYEYFRKLFGNSK